MSQYVNFGTTRHPKVGLKVGLEEGGCVVGLNVTPASVGGDVMGAFVVPAGLMRTDAHENQLDEL